MLTARSLQLYAWFGAELILVALLLLGGNATLIGASANIVTAGICAAEGERLTFARFLRYGLPITLAQLTVGAVYVVALFWLMR